MADAGEALRRDVLKLPDCVISELSICFRMNSAH